MGGIPNPDGLVGSFVHREAVLSSRIEQISGTQADLYAYEAGKLKLPDISPAPPESDIQELANYVRALDYGLKRIESLPVCLRLIRELHEILMKDVRGGQATPGEFRKTQNWIGPSNVRSPSDAPFVPPPINEMLPALEALEKYIHQGKDYPALIRLALIHYQFEAIHPFIDGNGRLGRLLISLLLVHWQLLPYSFLHLSAYFECFRDKYYICLLDVSERGKWEEWICFFLEAVTSQANDTIARARALQDLQSEWRSRLSADARATILSLQLADELLNKREAC